MAQKIAVIGLLLAMLCSPCWAGGNLSIFETPASPAQQKPAVEEGESSKPQLGRPPLSIPDSSDDEEDEEDDDWEEESIYDNDKSC
jgi:hypothetical protein